jgi:hypothetical protein
MDRQTNSRTVTFTTACMGSCQQSWQCCQEAPAYQCRVTPLLLASVSRELLSRKATGRIPCSVRFAFQPAIDRAGCFATG